jgi:hypothetical protein
MQRIRRMAAAAVTAATMLGLPGMTGTANANTAVPNNPYTPEGVCDSHYPGGGIGFEVVDQMTLDGGKAVTYLLRGGRPGDRPSNPDACAVTLKRGDAVGNSTMLGVWIEGPSWYPEEPPVLEGDEGEFQYYAGPVYHSWDCVHWGGRYGGDNAKKTPCYWAD